jgi:hypothetical protein
MGKTTTAATETVMKTVLIPRDGVGDDIRFRVSSGWELFQRLFGMRHRIGSGLWRWKSERCGKGDWHGTHLPGHIDVSTPDGKEEAAVWFWARVSGKELSHGN